MYNKLLLDHYKAVRIKDKEGICIFTYDTLSGIEKEWLDKKEKDFYEYSCSFINMGFSRSKLDHFFKHFKMQYANWEFFIGNLLQYAPSEVEKRFHDFHAFMINNMQPKIIPYKKIKIKTKSSGGYRFRYTSKKDVVAKYADDEGVIQLTEEIFDELTDGDNKMYSEIVNYVVCMKEDILKDE